MRVSREFINKHRHNSIEIFKTIRLLKSVSALFVNERTSSRREDLFSTR